MSDLSRVDIKRFINQDIKVGDIGSSQSLNRYAYCEGNPVSLVDPFGLSPETTQDQGSKSKYAFWHTVLDAAGFVFDGADIINTALYAKEGDWKNAAICAASAIPMAGAVIAGVAKGAKAIIKAKKAAKIAELAAEASRMIKPPGEIYRSKGLPTHMVKSKHYKALKYIDYIPEIISNPDYIGINPNENGEESIELIKRYRDNILVGIKLDKDNDRLYVSTMHDIQEGKIKRRLFSGRIKEFSFDKKE